MCKIVRLLNGSVEMIEDRQDLTRIIEEYLGEQIASCVAETTISESDYNELQAAYDGLIEENTIQENRINELEEQNNLLQLKIEQLQIQMELSKNKLDTYTEDDDEDIPF